jgi:hypothetical protein
MPQPERDHRSIDTYVQLLHGRLRPNPRAGVELSSGIRKSALVLNSSPSPLERREKKTTKNAERAMVESS